MCGRCQSPQQAQRLVVVALCGKEGPPSQESTGYREFVSDIDIIDRSYEDMLRRSEAVFDAQLELLIVSPEHRGKGVGKALYEAAMVEFRKRGKHSVLIFTDDDCGYGFYDQDGCERLETREIRLSSETLCNMMYRKKLDAEQCVLLIMLINTLALLIMYFDKTRKKASIQQYS